MFKLKQLRHENNLSLRNLSQRLDIPYSSLGKYERGEQQPNFENLLKIANYFNVSTDYLLGNSNYKTTKEEFNFKSTVEFNEENELLNLFKEITSCYQFLNNLYTDNNIRPGTCRLSNQLIRHLHCVVSAYNSINDCPPESIEEIGAAIGSFILDINTNFDSIKFSREFAHLYQNIIKPPTAE